MPVIKPMPPMSLEMPWNSSRIASRTRSNSLPRSSIVDGGVFVLTIAVPLIRLRAGSILAQHDVRRVLGRHVLGAAESHGLQVQSCQQGFAGAQQDRRDRQVHL